MCAKKEETQIGEKCVSMCVRLWNVRLADRSTNTHRGPFQQIKVMSHGICDAAIYLYVIWKVSHAYRFSFSSLDAHWLRRLHLLFL